MKKDINGPSAKRNPYLRISKYDYYVPGNTNIVANINRKMHFRLKNWNIWM